MKLPDFKKIDHHLINGMTQNIEWQMKPTIQVKLSQVKFGEA